MLSEVVLGLDHLHNHGFVHRDVKVSNELRKRELEEHDIVHEFYPPPLITVEFFGAPSFDYC